MPIPLTPISFREDCRERKKIYDFTSLQGLWPTIYQKYIQHETSYYKLTIHSLIYPHKNGGIGIITSQMRNLRLREIISKVTQLTQGRAGTVWWLSNPHKTITILRSFTQQTMPEHPLCAGHYFRQQRTKQTEVPALPEWTVQWTGLHTYPLCHMLLLAFHMHIWEWKHGFGI